MKASYLVVYQLYFYQKILSIFSFVVSYISDYINLNKKFLKIYSNDNYE